MDTAAEVRAVLVMLTGGGKAGITITGRVARLVKSNYGATKINLAGRRTKAVSTPGRIKGKKKTSSAGNESCTSPRS